MSTGRFAELLKAQTDVESYTRRSASGKLVRVQSYKRIVLGKVLAELKSKGSATLPDGRNVSLDNDGALLVDGKPFSGADELKVAAPGDELSDAAVSAREAASTAAPKPASKPKKPKADPGSGSGGPYASWPDSDLHEQLASPDAEDGAKNDARTELAFRSGKRQTLQSQASAALAELQTTDPQKELDTAQPGDTLSPRAVALRDEQTKKKQEEEHAAAVGQVADRAHEAWRAPRKKDDGTYEPREKDDGKGGKVDIANTKYADLPEKWQEENKLGAEAAIAAVKGQPKDAVDVEVAAAKVHDEWLKRNGEWAPPEQKKPYDKLSEEEKEKDRVFVRDAMKALGAKEKKVKKTEADRAKEGIAGDFTQWSTENIQAFLRSPNAEPAQKAHARRVLAERLKSKKDPKPTAAELGRMLEEDEKAVENRPTPKLKELSISDLRREVKRGGKAGKAAKKELDKRLSKVRGVIPNDPAKSNWVEVAGGLPPYIDDVAGALYTKRGFTVSHAIATAVNKIKKWMLTGSPEVKAKAAKAIAQWEKMKASTKLKKAYGPIYTEDEVAAVMELSVDERLEILADES